MESALLNLFTPVFFVLSFGIALAIIAIRSVVRAIAKRLSFLPDKLEGFLEDIWTEWILPAAPVAVGGLMAFLLADYPYPDPYADSASGRALFGLIAGFFSSGVYRFAKYHGKKYLPKKVKEKVDELGKKFQSTPPESTESESPPPEE